MNEYSCLQCHYSRGGPINGNCTRPMKMNDGSTLRMQRPWEWERNHLNPFWREKGRSLPDVCGARAKFWSEK